VPPTAITVTDQTTISSHVPCQSCGYDLYALARSATCPECGKPVSESLAGPAWLTAPWRRRAVVCGLFLLALAAVPIGLAALLATIHVATGIWFHVPWLGPVADLECSSLISGVVLLLGGVLLSVGLLRPVTFGGWLALGLFWLMLAGLAAGPILLVVPPPQRVPGTGLSIFVSPYLASGLWLLVLSSPVLWGVGRLLDHMSRHLPERPVHGQLLVLQWLLSGGALLATGSLFLVYETAGLAWFLGMADRPYHRIAQRVGTAALAIGGLWAIPVLMALAVKTQRAARRLRSPQPGATPLHGNGDAGRHSRQSQSR
jgi:ribosomal protein L37E